MYVLLSVSSSPVNFRAKQYICVVIYRDVDVPSYGDGEDDDNDDGGNDHHDE